MVIVWKELTGSTRTLVDEQLVDRDQSRAARIIVRSAKTHRARQFRSTSRSSARSRWSDQPSTASECRHVIRIRKRRSAALVYTSSQHQQLHSDGVRQGRRHPRNSCATVSGPGSRASLNARTIEGQRTAPVRRQGAAQRRRGSALPDPETPALAVRFVEHSAVHRQLRSGQKVRLERRNRAGALHTERRTSAKRRGRTTASHRRSPRERAQPIAAKSNANVSSTFAGLTSRSMRRRHSVRRSIRTREARGLRTTGCCLPARRSRRSAA